MAKRKYDQQLKDNVINEVIIGERSAAQVARDHEIPESAISALQIAEAQAVLDLLAAVSPFDYVAINVGRSACLVDGNVINTAAEIICYQAFLETIAPLESPIV